MDPLKLFTQLQPLVQKTAREQAEEVYREKGTMFGVASVPFHTHNGIDAPQISYVSGLEQRIVPIHWTLPGSSAATAANYGTIWTAPFACTVVGATEVHQVAGSDPGSVTLQIEKLTGTLAPDAGATLLTTAFNMKGTANTVQNGSIVLGGPASGIRYATLAKGDRLCLKDAGTLTAVSNVTVVILVQY